MTTFAELFNTILTADKESSRKAARLVRKSVYSSYGHDKYEHIIAVIEIAPNEYAKITDDFRQENFVVAISTMYFLHNRENQPDFLFPWLFELLWHKNGNIRHAAVRMIKNELGPLTYHIRFPNEARATTRGVSRESANHILLKLFSALNNLLHESWKPEHKRYKYIDSLPSSTYKSAQLILSELEEDCGEDYIKQMEEALHLVPK
ncbi:MAG: hypothetical protein AAB529_02385 [Patescibacteria group bacterium]